MRAILLTLILFIATSLASYSAYRYYFPKTYYFKCSGTNYSTYTNKRTGDIKRTVTKDSTSDFVLRDYGFFLGKTIEPWSLSQCRSETESIFCQGKDYLDLFDIVKSKLTKESIRTLDFDGDPTEFRDLWASTECNRQQPALD